MAERKSKKTVTAIVEKTVPAEKISVPPVVMKKTYSSAVMVNDPLPQANDIFVERQIGTVVYDEVTETVTTHCMMPNYEALFNRFSGMTYYVETNDAPIPMIRTDGEKWMKNLYKAISLKVNEERNITFWVTEPAVINEEPVLQ
tara:strand:+ start:308 stop:739 length:432 start_codon:yes stop_codon:yes gene_type:complete